MHTYHALLQQLETYNLGFSSSRLATAEKAKRPVPKSFTGHLLAEVEQIRRWQRKCGDNKGNVDF